MVVSSFNTGLLCRDCAVDLTRDRHGASSPRPIQDANVRWREVPRQSTYVPPTFQVDIQNVSASDPIRPAYGMTCAGTAGSEAAHHCEVTMTMLMESQSQNKVSPLLLLEDGGKCTIYNVTGDSRTLKVALSGAAAEEWLESLHDEYKSIASNDVFEVVDAPKGVNIVGSRWILKYKRNAFGEIERRKSRLVAQGFSQKPGVDYNELYSPTPQQATFRMLLLYAARLT